MPDYRAPIDEMRFVLGEIAELDSITGLPGFEETSAELVDQILEEAGKLAGGVMAPLNQVGDRQRSVLENGVVRTPEGFKEAYAQFVEGGWNGLTADPQWGGQGLPALVAAPLQEMWNSANMSLALAPILTQAAIELLQIYGTPEQQETYLPKIVSGEWAGTMELTEPQAGSDVGALKTRAERANGHYKITGQKIYISYGDHDLTENIIHLVLARTPDAPAGTKGISLFLVPKFLVNADGSLGERNDLRPVSMEHKMGLHASPTCVMSYGDDGGATGYLIGEECQGLTFMFTMMNNARLNVGIQGLAIAERAYQQARDYAFERVQSRPVDGGRDAEAVAIVHHPDVRRMLIGMKARIEGMRALAYFTAAELDRSRNAPDEEARERHRVDGVDLLTPMVKAWCTDLGEEVASLAIQVHGGMGYIEETGVAQHYRDARIARIYEGTNGIQAMDLIGRKVLRYKGETAKRHCQRMKSDLADDAGRHERLTGAIARLEEATDWLTAAAAEDMQLAAAGATPYLRLFATVTAAWLLAKGADAAREQLEDGEGNPGVLEARIGVERFFAQNLLPEAEAAFSQTVEGSKTVLELPIERL